MTTIELELDVDADIGVAPQEIGRLQRITITVEAQVADDASTRAVATGDLAQTLDYGEIRAAIHAVLQLKRYRLLEDLSASIRDRVLQLPHVRSARVGVTKYLPWPDVRRLTLTR